MEERVWISKEHFQYYSGRVNIADLRNVRHIISAT